MLRCSERRCLYMAEFGLAIGTNAMITECPTRNLVTAGIASQNTSFPTFAWHIDHPIVLEHWITGNGNVVSLLCWSMRLCGMALFLNESMTRKLWGW